MAETSFPPVVAPRRTRLIRADGLRVVQHAIVEALFERDTVEALRSYCVLVPTRAAAAALRRTIEDSRLVEPGSASAWPLLVTRAELYAVLHERIGGEPPRLTDFEREVLLRRSAREVAADLAPPFQLRPGLVVEILRFYDDLRRRHRTVEAYERLMVDELEPGAAYDRGADRLLRQTRFLAATFRRYEAAVAGSGGVDEHQLRARLIACPAKRPISRAIVAVGDEASEEGGLWSADFDLLARISGLEAIDVFATEEQLAAGFYDRLVSQLPGIQEESRAAAPPPPILLAPPVKADVAPLFFTARDREEELADIARMLKARRSPIGRFGVVFQRPLPYLYLARHVFSSGGIGYEASDALPLAAEPYAAALDVVFSCLISDFTRDALVDLLRLPQFAFAGGGARLHARETAALNHLLLDAKYLGGRDALRELAGKAHGGRLGDDAKRALEAALTVSDQLQNVLTANSASEQLDRLAAFLRRHERLPAPSASWRDRHLRARAAVLAALEGLRDAHARFDDTVVPPAELNAAVRRWVEGQTFAPRTGAGGVHLVDADAARFATFDELRIVGLVERDWPLRTPRSIFYPGWLLTQLGWPAEPSRLASARAAFRDLLQMPARRVSVSTFSLEDDALTAPSTFLEELESLSPRAERPPAPPPQRIFVHEALAFDPVVPAVSGETADWLRLRIARTTDPTARRAGDAGSQPTGTFAVSHLERYLECPFKYFAAFVLRLEEERDEELGMRATERGQFLHDLLMEFFRRWQESGQGALSPDNAADALEVFRALATERLATLSPLDRALEEGRLLGTAAAPGLAERLFAFELEREVPVVERLLEHRLEGEYAFTAGDRHRTLRIKAQADRIDLLADGTLRVIDYKLGRAPRPSRALQLPIYGVCAAQSLEGHRGRTWKVGEAGYVAFGERDVFRPLGQQGGIGQALAEGQERLLTAVEGIERGEFPPRPDEPYLCTYCAYAAVCRKDYVGDE